jgi:hypothetical protein
MEILTNVVLLDLLGATMAVALWAWHEVGDIATGWQAAHAAQRRRHLPGRAHHRGLDASFQPMSSGEGDAMKPVADRATKFYRT